MDIKLSYKKEEIEYVDLDTDEPTGSTYIIHTIESDINGQIFKNNFIITPKMDKREEARLFGLKLQEIGKMIERQAGLGKSERFTVSKGTAMERELIYF